ncbi:MAG TPA: hypothetical protein VKP65_22770 [Rhodothermales bacterium]|nr:hypothetical protein [Rhodothermales bacterium]
MRRHKKQETTCGIEIGAYPNHIQLLSSHFRYAHKRLFFGRARLFADRIELAGWSASGYHFRCLPLARMVDVDYHPLKEDSNLTFYLDDGEEISIRVQEAHRWRECYENWLRYEVLPSAKLIGGPEQAAAVAG